LRQIRQRFFHGAARGPPARQSRRTIPKVVGARAKHAEIEFVALKSRRGRAGPAAPDLPRPRVHFSGQSVFCQAAAIRASPQGGRFRRRSTRPAPQPSGGEMPASRRPIAGLSKVGVRTGTHRAASPGGPRQGARAPRPQRHPSWRPDPAAEPAGGSPQEILQSSGRSARQDARRN